MMPLYAITYEHPDETGWRQHVVPHVTDKTSLQAIGSDYRACNRSMGHVFS
jgi:hypothetical protein